MDQNREFACALSIWILNYMTSQKVLMIKKSNSYHANCAISTRPRWMRENLFLCVNFGDLKDFLYITISQYIYISQGCKMKIFRICQHLQLKLNMELILPVFYLIKANKNWIEICSASICRSLAFVSLNIWLMEYPEMWLSEIFQQLNWSPMTLAIERHGIFFFFNFFIFHCHL